MLVSGTGPHKHEGAIVMLTIGEFSRLSHVSARMLRYYDAMGPCAPTGWERTATAITASASLWIWYGSSG